MRLLTIFAIIFGCTFAVLRGWDVVGFTLAETRTHPDGPHAADLGKWDSVPGLRSLAFRARLMQSSAGTGVATRAQRTEQLTALLATKPLSSIDWLALAGSRVTDAASEDKILTALTMSYVTGPNEGAVMLQRGIFGLIEWDILPKQGHERTIRDLSGAIQGAMVSDQANDVIRGILVAKPADTRSEIATMLAAERVPEKRLVAFGL
jgi:hypothetical protein